jgi:hypothetical protein
MGFIKKTNSPDGEIPLTKIGMQNILGNINEGKAFHAAPKKENS